MEELISTEEILSKIHILIVEDDRIMRTLIRDMLGILGFKSTTVAKDGEEAVDYLHYNNADIVICDWKMQGMDGIAFTRYIREKMPGGKRFLPIIMLTGKTDQQDVLTARDAGVSEYLVKPFTAESLYSRIRAVVESPRGFVLSEEYVGPDRRRRRDAPPDQSYKRETDES